MTSRSEGQLRSQYNTETHNTVQGTRGHNLFLSPFWFESICPKSPSGKALKKIFFKSEGGNAQKHSEAVSKKTENKGGTGLALSFGPGSPPRLTAADPINGPPAPFLHFTELIQATRKF